MKGSLSSAQHPCWKRDWRGRGRLWITNTAPAEPAGWEGRARGIRGVAPGKANSADPSHLPGEEEECQGFFYKTNDVFNCFFHINGRNLTQQQILLNKMAVSADYF